MVKDTSEPYLERDFGLRLILHERDFPGGVTIIYNIIQAVERSRRMIVLLTRQVILFHLSFYSTQLRHNVNNMDTKMFCCPGHKKHLHTFVSFHGILVADELICQNDTFHH